MRATYLCSGKNTEGKRDAQNSKRFQKGGRTDDGSTASEYHLFARCDIERGTNVYALRIHDPGRSA